MFRYKAFLSYSHKDRFWGRWLLKALETYRIPKHLVGQKTDKGIVPKHLIPIFRDRDDLPATEDLSAEIRDALANSEFLIVLCSPHGAKSPWVNKEIEEFKRQRGPANIRCVIVGGEANANLSKTGTINTDYFPKALRHNKGKQSEPVAADLRADGDGKRLALLKMVAGMIGVRLDEIIRRDLQRKNRRVTMITLVTVVAMITMGSLTFTAIEAERKAEQGKEEAEGLIEFMLTDLRDKLEPVGRLDVLDAVGEKAISYYAMQQLQDLSEDSLGRRARAFHLLGEIEDLQGDLEGAQIMFQAASEATLDMLKRNPNNQHRIFDHSQSVFWVGFLKWQRGNFKAAEVDFEIYRDLAEQLVSLDPDNTDWQMELIYANSNLGTLYLSNLDEPQKALKTFQDLLAQSINLFGPGPEDSQRALDLANTYGWLADSAKIASNLPEAETFRQKQIFLLEKVLEKNPENVYATGEGITAQLGLARLAMAQGEVLYAVNSLESLVKTSETLIEHDASNTNWLKQAARHYLYLTEAYLQADSLNEAEEALSRGQQLIEDYSRAKEIFFREKVQLTFLYQVLEAKIQYLRSDHSAAIKTSRKTIEEIKKALADGARATDAYLVLTDALLIAGFSARTTGDEMAASASWQGIINIVEPRISIEGPETLENLATAYALLGLGEEAVKINQTLISKGYKKRNIYFSEEEILDEKNICNEPKKGEPECQLAN